MQEMPQEARHEASQHFQTLLQLALPCGVYGEEYPDDSSVISEMNPLNHGGTPPETNEIVTNICSCHNFFFPFFCANNFYTSLLLIVCALK